MENNRIFKKKTFYLEGGVVTGEAGGVEGDVGHGPGLAHHEDLERLRHLAASQDSRVDQLPTLAVIIYYELRRRIIKMNNVSRYCYIP